MGAATSADNGPQTVDSNVDSLRGPAAHGPAAHGPAVHGPETPAPALRGLEKPGADALAPQLEALRQLQREMLQLASSAPTKLALLGGLADLLDRGAAPVAIVYFQRDAEGELCEAVHLRPEQDDSRRRRFAKQLQGVCQTACAAGHVEVRRQAAPARILLAAPIPLRGSDPEAIGLIFPADQPASHLVMLAQMLASHVVLWHVLAAAPDHAGEARDAAAVVELLDQIAAAKNVRQACQAVAGDLETYLQCERVAIGLRTGGQGRCRLEAISGVAQFDRRSATSHAIESAMDEAVVRKCVTQWPAGDEQPPHGALAHRSLISQDDVAAVVSMPIAAEGDSAVGAVIVFNARDSQAVERFLTVAGASLAVSLAAAQRHQGGPLLRLARGVGRIGRTSKGKACAVAAGLSLAALLIPAPHRIRCDCQIEPVTRRFVAAPFEGTLEKSLVKPGDIVGAGDVLARLDGREVRWERAGVVADQQQAAKRRDAAQASHNYGDQQIAQLEIQRLNVAMELLDHRAENLEIRSPVGGIVVSGDLERAEGAPLTVGQTLFEIAPLERMIVEIAVPDDDIAHLAPGQSIEVRLNAYPGESWQAVVERIQPRSEVRDEDNVFIAEAELKDPEGRLRPGMKGRSKIRTGRRSLGWIWFHKPWEHLTKKLSW